YQRLERFLRYLQAHADFDALASAGEQGYQAAVGLLINSTNALALFEMLSWLQHQRPIPRRGPLFFLTAADPQFIGSEGFDHPKYPFHHFLHNQKEVGLTELVASIASAAPAATVFAVPTVDDQQIWQDEEGKTLSPKLRNRAY